MEQENIEGVRGKINNDHSFVQLPINIPFSSWNPFANISSSVVWMMRVPLRCLRPRTCTTRPVWRECMSLCLAKTLCSLSCSPSSLCVFPPFIRLWSVLFSCCKFSSFCSWPSHFFSYFSCVTFLQNLQAKRRPEFWQLPNHLQQEVMQKKQWHWFCIVVVSNI